MPYTYRSLAFTWLIFCALFAVSASGAAEGWRLVLMLAAALTVPTLVLRTQTAVVPAGNAPMADPGGIDVVGWPHEGARGRSRRRR